MTLKLRVWLTLPVAAAAMLNLPMPIMAQGGQGSAATTSSGSDLSPSQKARMEAGRLKYQQDIAALRADTKLTNAQKQKRFIAITQAADKGVLAILTPPQRTLVLKQREISSQFQKGVEALRTNSKLSDAQKQAAYKTLLQNRQDALLATLPPAQRTRMTELKRISQDLQQSLSKNTQAQIRQFNLATQAKMQAVDSNAALPPTEKAARIKALEQELEAKINTVLTSKQRAEFARYHQLINPNSPQ